MALNAYPTQLAKATPSLVALLTLTTNKAHAATYPTPTACRATYAGELTV